MSIRRAPTSTLLALAACLLLASAATRAQTTVHLTKEQALEHVFPTADRVLELRHLLSPEETNRIEALCGRRLDEGGFYIYTGLSDGEPVGYASIVAQIGKTKPITHIVGVTPDGEVGEVAVMIYRESIGDEVAAQRFMDQYRDLTLDDPIRIDRDIINIAGATLSGHAICRGVRKALAVVHSVMLDRSAVERERLLGSADDVTPESLARAWEVDEPAGAGYVRVERRIMGTTCAVEAYADVDDATLTAAAEAALDEVARWDDVLSNWRDTTPLSRLNVAPTGRAQTVDPGLLDWLVDAREWTQRTDGAFDPSVGSLVDAWRLMSSSPARPTPDEHAAARRSSGIDLLDIDAAAGTVTRWDEAVRLDPGASGKGFALDRAAAVLRGRGIERWLISFRSTVLAGAPPPGRESWPLPIVHDRLGRTVSRAELRHQALSVSGGSLRAFRDGDVDRGHVIDPDSGVPVEADRLAWVVHPSASASDALATALLVRGSALPVQPDAVGAYIVDETATIVSWPAQP